MTSRPQSLSYVTFHRDCDSRRPAPPVPCQGRMNRRIRRAHPETATVASWDVSLARHAVIVIEREIDAHLRADGVVGDATCARLFATLEAADQVLFAAEATLEARGGILVACAEYGSLAATV